MRFLIRCLLPALLAATSLGAVACSEEPPPPAPRSTAGATEASAAGALALIAGPDVLVQDARGQRRTVTTLEGAGALSAPLWTPDGASIVYVVRRYPQREGGDWGDDVFSVQAPGDAPKRLRQHTSPGEQIAGMTWSGPGALILSLITPVYEGARISGVTARLNRFEVATGHSTTLAPNGLSPSASRDGTVLAYLRFERDLGLAELVAADGDGGNARVLVPATQFPRLLYPRVSPDGTHIAFSSSDRIAADFAPRDGVAPRRAPRSLLERVGDLVRPVRAEAHGLPMDVWTVRVADGALTRLTTLLADEPYPAWSADGQRVLIIATGGMYEVASDGRGLREIGGGLFGGQLDVRW